MVNRIRGRRWSDQTLLPMRTTRQLFNTVSCWYCDFKFSTFNEPLFRFGRRHSRSLRVWFSMGIGFSLAALFGVTVIMVCEFVRAAFVYTGNNSLGDSLSLLGLSSLIAGLNISLPSMGYLIVSSVICVIVHEFGHALAAASEGVPLEYIAVFWAVLFPVCNLALLLLPFILSPFYVHGRNPMVLDVPSTSPLSGYLSPYDVIYSVDDIRIHTPQEWKQTIILLTQKARSSSYYYSGISNVRRGYCVPRFLSGVSIHLELEMNQTAICPSELVAFAPVICGGAHEETKSIIYCLDAKDVVKLKKCGYYGNVRYPTNQIDCHLCTEIESCLAPVQQLGQGWIEITYSSPQCKHETKTSLFSDEKHSIRSEGENGCLQSFVFIGDLISMAHSIHLTSYQPRFSIYFGTHLPNLLEKFLTCSFHVSLLLALLNSLPVYFLDGECILEETLNYFRFLSSKMKQMILRLWLLLGTFISIFFVVQSIFVVVS
ncbi:protease m50 membrane-bound transcription factorsite 2 protease [Striga asiatica]|uniref:Protease m50 membrane-bound transcription factorsite 2 protease n=1 Tax=Striga asiatica TaxID=4170 RepID=A0A5A7R1J1_STRAF|nr:protease m50 membrane-bound transcription factorsite 2 protease [Striga asiatica]